MKKNKKLNNKGFSLVELIIVVAIMAVLVGVLAPQYMRYVDRSRAGVDEQLADSIRQAITTLNLDPAYADAPGATLARVEMADAGASVFWNDVYETLGIASGNYADLQAELSLDTSGEIFVTITDGSVTVEITGGDYTGANAILVN